MTDRCSYMKYDTASDTSINWPFLLLTDIQYKHCIYVLLQSSKKRICGSMQKCRKNSKKQKSVSCEISDLRKNLCNPSKPLQKIQPSSFCFWVVKKKILPNIIRIFYLPFYKEWSNKKFLYMRNVEEIKCLFCGIACVALCSLSWYCFRHASVHCWIAFVVKHYCANKMFSLSGFLLHKLYDRNTLKANSTKNGIPKCLRLQHLAMCKQF